MYAMAPLSDTLKTQTAAPVATVVVAFEAPHISHPSH